MKITYNGISFDVVNPKLEQQIMALCLGSTFTPTPEKPKKKSTYNTWTPRDLEILRKALVNKHPIKEIVKFLDFKFTINAINAAAYKHYPTLIKAITGNSPFKKHQMGINQVEQNHQLI